MDHATALRSLGVFCVCRFVTASFSDWARTRFCSSSSPPPPSFCVWLRTQLNQIVDDLVVMILKRAEMGKNYGVVMLPEGLIEFIPEFNALISDINDVLASGIPTTIGELFVCVSIR